MNCTVVAECKRRRELMSWRKMPRKEITALLKPIEEQAKDLDWLLERYVEERQARHQLIKNPYKKSVRDVLGLPTAPLRILLGNSIGFRSPTQSP